MTFGIETYRPNGSVAMTGANKAGIFIEAVTLSYNYNANGSKVYNQIPAGSMFVVVASAGGQYTPSVSDDGAGHAKLVWTYSPYGGEFLNSTANTVFLVFAKKLNQTDTYGILLYNDDGDQMADYNYPVPQYAGVYQPTATPHQSWYATDENYQRNDHQFLISYRPTTNRLIAVNLPDSTDNDAWYCCRPFIGAGATRYDSGTGQYYTDNIPWTITCMRKVGKTYQVPSVHIFSVDGPTSGGGSYGIQYSKPDGTLIYDSSAENISIIDQGPAAYGGRSNTVTTMSVTMPSTPGLVIPYLAQDMYASQTPDINGNDGNYSYWRGVFQRRGNTLYRRMMNTSVELVTGGTQYSFQSGVPNGNFFMITDVSQLSPSSVQGTPNSAFLP